ncbi:hypothetical protein BVRB_9g210220 [Beta vulgaris subsp. vulgaris]|nr:hypothetical protein BVRB_9g210220 [Beta vulgaris subsp. vulgaris]
MIDKIEKKTRLDSRTVTVSARATRVARISSQDPDSGVGGSSEEHVIEPWQHEEDNGKHKWVKHPRTCDWKLTAQRATFYRFATWLSRSCSLLYLGEKY